MGHRKTPLANFSPELAFSLIFWKDDNLPFFLTFINILGFTSRQETTKYACKGMRTRGWKSVIGIWFRSLLEWTVEVVSWQSYFSNLNPNAHGSFRERYPMAFWVDWPNNDDEIVWMSVWVLCHPIQGKSVGVVLGWSAQYSTAAKGGQWFSKNLLLLYFCSKKDCWAKWPNTFGVSFAISIIVHTKLYILYVELPKVKIISKIALHK